MYIAPNPLIELPAGDEPAKSHAPAAYANPDIYLCTAPLGIKSVILRTWTTTVRFATLPCVLLCVSLASCGGGSGNTTASATDGGGGSTTGNTSTSFQIASGSYSVSQTAGSLTVTVNRGGNGTGAVTVDYATADGTAVAGTNYTATKGTLSWALNDSAAKTFAVPVNGSPAFSGTKSLTVTLSNPTGGATLGPPVTATLNINGSVSSQPSGVLSIAVQGSQLVNGSGAVVQLRGADVSGLEFAAIQGFAPTDPWGGQSPNWKALQSWKLNAVRIPLNEASWLGLTTYDWPSGAQRTADPGSNYQKTVIDTVNAAVAAGFYVILDLHLSAPNATVTGITGKVPVTPTEQNQMADADHSPAFWTSVANTFKSNPAVIFDLFNEPHIDGFANNIDYRSADAWVALRDGGTATSFRSNSTTIGQSYQTAGMQTLLNAVRATGATNVVMSAGISWAQDTSMWATYAPVDPIHQLAASWHAYPQAETGAGATVPGFGTDNYTWAKAILTAGYPLIIGETGDHSTTGSTAPFMANLLPWLDQNGVSVLGWSWNAWGATDDDLILDANGTPTDGYGKAYQTWAVNHP